MATLNNPKSAFHVFLRRLTNLSGSNRMLFLSRLSEGKHIDFQKFSFLSSTKADAQGGIGQGGGLNSFALLEKILRGKQVSICPIVDPRLPSGNKVSESLKVLQRSVNSLFEEGGTKDLHIGWPFVRGKFIDGTWVQCPLVLFPVDLVAVDREWRLVPNEGAPISFNKSFLLALSFYNKTPLVETLLEADFEDVDRDSTVFRTALYSMLQKENLEINFNPNMYQDFLESFPFFSKDEFDQAHQPGQLKLFSQAVLGVFPQADSYLVPDYVKMIEYSLSQDIHDFFQARSVALPESGKRNFINDISEEKLFTPFAADSFQENILKAVKLGNSLVVQGPPGTGKSQLICNLLADALACKKNVLVVCQKRAALDVVWERMNKAGFADFIGLVHDFKNDRREIFARLAAQIDKVREYKVRVNGLDAIQLDRNFIQAGKQIEHIVEAVEEFRRALFDTSECGMSIKDLYLNTDLESKAIINLKQEFSQFRMDDIGKVLLKIKSLGNYRTILEWEGNPWRFRKPFVNLPPSSFLEIKNSLSEIPQFMQHLSDQAKEITGATLDFQQAEIFAKRVDDLKLLRKVLSDHSVYQALNQMVTERSGETDTLWIRNIQRVVDEIFSDEGPEISIEVSQLGKFQNALFQRLKARRSLISFVKWQLFSDEKYLVKRAMVANNLSGSEGLKKLERKLDVRLNLEHNLSKLRAKPWIKNIPNEYSKTIFAKWFNELELASRCNNLFDEIRNLKNFLSPHRVAHNQFLEVMDNFIALIEGFLSRQAEWAKYLSGRQMEEVGSNFSKGSYMVQYLQQNFDTMCEYDELMASLSQAESDIVQKLIDSTEHKSTGDELCKIFHNSLGLAWIDQIEAKWPELRMVSSGKLEQLERDLRESIALKSRISEEMVLLRARERATDDLDYNRLNNLTSYRDLHHEVTKKKRIWPLRKLIGAYHQEIFNIMPVWLASPESVSALFPLEGLFDLVIFDEASQCFAERGIPAMARAKQVVVAGDNQQLKPADFFHTRWDEETNSADMEVESLLDLASRHLLTLNLQGHYRSQSPELVEFSNRNFYQNKLELLPHRDKLNSLEPAIQFIKVNGIWENQINEIEALKVADLVFEISQRLPDKEIGVITFNQPQQMLVMDMVEEKFVREGSAVPLSLIIKNIENVQGDEKDIIIFSIGYAPDNKGKLNAQFGSLNIVGGENRLNVAITRAREKVIVVCSLWPNEFITDETKNLGPKLLKQYLHFAHAVSERREMAAKPESGKHPDWYLKYRLLLKPNDVLFDFFPNADIVLKEKNGFGSVLLTDDNFYQQALSAKHHHALLPILLEGKNWNYHFVYSRNFWRDRKRFGKEIERMYAGSKNTLP